MMGLPCRKLTNTELENTPHFFKVKTNLPTLLNARAYVNSLKAYGLAYGLAGIIMGKSWDNQ